jgi:hypothetical protein
MDALIHLEDKIRSTGAALGRLEAELPRYTGSRSLLSNILSLRKLHENLSAEYDAVANDIGFDILHYRILDDHPSARTLAKSVNGFQDAFSLIYEATRTGPKQRRIFNPELAHMSELRAAYTYPGSFGIVFTIPNERLLIPDQQTALEDAAMQVMEIAKAGSNTKVIADAVKAVGKAPIVAIYEWAKNNAANNAGAAIDWQRERTTRDSVLLQAPEFAALSETIEKTSEIIETIESFEGTLVGADVKSKRFHFIADNATASIHGRFSDAISEEHKAELPARYMAVIRKTVQTTFATEEEKISYFLSKLDDPKQPEEIPQAEDESAKTEKPDT